MMKSTLSTQPVLGCLLVWGAMVAIASAQATEPDDKKVPETFTTTTANMDPAGEDLRFSVLRWSSEADRHAVVDVLMSPAADEGQDAELSALIELPSFGTLWSGNSGLGYALKYAQRVATPDGGEHLTFVTDRRLGTFSREPWTSTDGPATPVRAFTVIELRLDSNGDGEGKMSVSTDVVFDTKSSTVALGNYDAAPVLLEAVKRQPPPYWVR